MLYVQTMVLLVLQHCVSRWNVYILQKMIHGPSNVKNVLFAVVDVNIYLWSA